jgi:dCMP deaminase
VISYGYNGTPAGWDNVCENKIYPDKLLGDFEQHPDEFDAMFPYTDSEGQRYKLKTRPEVLHAEMNALMKLAKSNRSGENAAIFITHAPCMECAKGIYSAGITEVFYRNEYRSNDGVYFLRRCGINVSKYDNQE